MQNLFDSAVFSDRFSCNSVVVETKKNITLENVKEVNKKESYSTFLLAPSVCLNKSNLFLTYTIFDSVPKFALFLFLL